jgi:hypothetical protein
MAAGKTPTDLDALINEEAKATGLAPDAIRDAVQRELASRAAKRIVDKIEAPAVVAVGDVDMMSVGA